MSARRINVRGIVVARHAVGEGSLKVLLYTDALGLVWTLAQSARTERSQLRAHLQSGTRGTFTLLKGRDVWRTTGAVRTRNAYFEYPGTDAPRAAARVLSFVRQFVRGEGSDPYFFETLWNFFEFLPYTDPEALRAAETVAVLRLLTALGYVEDTERVSPFLTSAFDTAVTQAADGARTALVKAINEGISASGLA